MPIFIRNSSLTHIFLLVKFVDWAVQMAWLHIFICGFYIVHGLYIKITIFDFDIEPSQGSQCNCLYDHLTVYGGPDRGSPQLHQFCEKTTTQTEFTSQGRNMLVAFYSDGSIRGKGFHAHYTTVPGGKYGINNQYRVYIMCQIF